ncbi:hypothetical protein [Dyadobacter psychrotolerans]|uniref:Uncharacterized protein n=1 Tax=Dyadobacter psychrotolerans TaxID=2541721 RepID=A0A4R5DNZ1_9BACT|nr:hypothetical protein [Dyadobacter psychrotolerans]TDE13731.1 hypothetical protein E0F88_17680 [Dyadobacter psychrotolerans]
MKKFISLLLIFVMTLGVAGMQPLQASPEKVKAELLGKKKKKFKGFQKPKSKKILGIFKRKTDCGCPNH